MTTIRESLADAATWAEVPISSEAFGWVLTALSIDPDLPPEWATVDRCIDWLRQRFGVGHVLSIDVPPGGASTAWFGSVTEPRRAYYGRTLHRALLAVCQAAQEAP